MLYLKVRPSSRKCRRWKLSSRLRTSPAAASSGRRDAAKLPPCLMSRPTLFSAVRYTTLLITLLTNLQFINNYRDKNLKRGRFLKNCRILLLNIGSINADSVEGSDSASDDKPLIESVPRGRQLRTRPTATKKASAAPRAKVALLPYHFISYLYVYA